MKNAIELIRVSTEGQAKEDRAGIPAQREINRRTALAHDLKIVKTIEIVDVSGAAVLQSPEIRLLLELMESPDVHGVIAKEFSRLMRPEKFADYALLQHFIDTNTVLYLPEGPIDFASKSGQLYGTIRAAMAGLERREIVERMMDAKEAMRRQGKHAGGPAQLPFGVSYSKERGWSYTDEAEKVRKAFSLFLGGQTSYTIIGERLNIPRTSVRFILENPVYAGWRVYDEKRDRSAAGYVPRPGGRQGYRKKIARASGEQIRVHVLDGLVSEADFSRVQQIIELKRKNHWRVRGENPNRYTYNGFLRCGDCGELLYTHSSVYDFYICKTRHTRERRIRAAVGLGPCENRYMLRRKLESKLDTLLGQKLQQKDFLHEIADRFCETAETRKPTDGTSVALKLRQLEERRQRVLEAFFDGVLSKMDRDTRIAEADREIQAYQRVLLDSARPARPGINLDAIQEALEPFSEWEFLKREDRRALLSGLCPQISVNRYMITGLTLNLSAVCGDGDDVSLERKAR